MAEPIYHRIHPLTMVVELPRALRQLAGLFIVAILSYFNGGFSAEMSGEAIAAALGLLLVIPPVVRYYSYGYSIHNGDLLIRSGVISRNLRTIPLSRIQNINLKRNLLHRIFGLVDLEIETAAGVKAEASISALSEEQAHTVKAQLLGQRVQTYTRLVREKDRNVIYHPTSMELFLVGATENRFATMMAAILGLAGLQQSLLPMLIRNSGAKGDPAKFGWIVAALLLAMILVGWVASIVSAFVKYYGFELTLDDGKLRREYGLINHFETVLPVRRIQTVHVDQNFLQRWLGICKLYAATAGGMHLSSGNEQHPHVQAPPLLTPVLRDSARFPLLHTAIPGADFESAEWHQVGKNTILRHMRTGFWPALIIASALYGTIILMRNNMTPEDMRRLPLLQSWSPYAAFVLFFAMAIFSGWIFYKTARYSYNHRLLATRVGWLKTRWNYVPVNKIQLVTVTQNPAQRWLRLATVTAHSAATLFQNTELDDIPADQGFIVAEQMHKQAGDTRDSLLDGF